ncbi:MAG: hypothetical protein QG574_5237 [Cyanobacteriota bacterium erpe_2018_sw_21hr_WHONDRS-SW48-000092_B_bin.40]|nr:hypothetical protein [Cyanobacteriota bacterium erpe_2018_sw_21hr_WHONDRS-SW48-000092_B_bin.40]
MVPERFPIKPELGHKGGSIPWSDAEPLVSVWQSRYGCDSTDYRGSMMRLACEGGLPASQLDSFAKQVAEDCFWMTGESRQVVWRQRFVAGDAEHWKAQALMCMDCQN